MLYRKLFKVWKKEHGVTTDHSAFSKGMKSEGEKPIPEQSVVLFLLGKAFARFYKKRIKFRFYPEKSPSLNSALYTLYFFLPEEARDVFVEFIEEMKIIWETQKKKKEIKPEFLRSFKDVGKI